MESLMLPKQPNMPIFHSPSPIFNDFCSFYQIQGVCVCLCVYSKFLRIESDKIKNMRKKERIQRKSDLGKNERKSVIIKKALPYNIEKVTMSKT